MLSKRCVFFRNLQTMHYSNHNGLKVEKTFHPGDILGYLGMSFLYKDAYSQRKMERHMNGEMADNLNPDIKNILLQELELFNAIGLGLRFPVLFDLAALYGSEKSYVRSFHPGASQKRFMDAKLTMSAIEREEYVEEVTKRIEFEIGESIELDPFTEEECEKITEIYNFVIENNAKINQIDYLFRNPGLVLDLSIGPRQGMNRE